MPLEQINKNGKRLYQIDGVTLPSISTLSTKYQPKFALFAWKKKLGEEAANAISQASSLRGTTLHKAIETGIKVEDLTEEYRPFLEQFNSVRHLIDIQNQETPVYYKNSEDKGFAGTLDFTAIFDGSEVIGDFKFTEKPKELRYTHNYWLQLAGYCFAYNRMFKKTVDRLLLVNVTAEKPFLYLTSPEQTSLYIENFLEIVKCYYRELNFDWKKFINLAPLPARVNTD